MSILISYGSAVYVKSSGLKTRLLSLAIHSYTRNSSNTTQSQIPSIEQSINGQSDPINSTYAKSIGNYTTEPNFNNDVNNEENDNLPVWEAFVCAMFMLIIVIYIYLSGCLPMWFSCCNKK